MPFTFAHPTILLPFFNKNRKIFSATGLIIGSICTDFESFITLDEHKLYSHTWGGMFWFDTPLTLMLAFIFHSIVRDQLIQNLPAFIGDRFNRFIDFNWNRFFRQHFIAVIISILIGIASHLLWDAVTQINWTHPNGHNRAMVIWNVYVHIILQGKTHPIGLILIAAYIMKMPSAANYHPVGINRKIQFWMIVVLITGIETALASFFISKPISIALYIDIVISGAMLGLLMACVTQKAIKAG